MAKFWGRLGAANKVETEYSSSGDDSPVPGLVEILGAPPFIGGTYIPATKRVTGVPPGPALGRPEELRAKPVWTPAEQDEAFELVLRKLL